MRSIHFSLLVALFFALTSTALASTKWYVDGVSGSDGDSCTSATTACKTIGHSISLAASGDTIKVAAATYRENLTIGINLKILGSGAKTTIIDGGGVNAVVTIGIITAPHVTLSGVTIRHGAPGIVVNYGSLMVLRSAVIGNRASSGPNSFGGGIWNFGILTISNSTVAGNRATCTSCVAAWGGGIDNRGTATINNSTISGNTASNGCTKGGELFCQAQGGGIHNQGTLTISSSTISGNIVSLPHCISKCSVGGGGISNFDTSTTIQNSIVANNSVGNCNGRMISNGYNLNSDTSCQFDGPGDMNNINPQLAPLQNSGGPTRTMALLPGSPAIDAGNPKGCTDGNGNLLKTDQRGMPRPDREDIAGCDIGAFERQTD